MPYVETKNLLNFKEWLSECMDDIKRGRYLIILTDDNEIFVVPNVTTQGLIKPFITGLTDKEVGDMKSYFTQQGIKVKECKHFYIDDRKDPREIKKAE